MEKFSLDEWIQHVRRNEQGCYQELMARRSPWIWVAQHSHWIPPQPVPSKCCLDWDSRGSRIDIHLNNASLHWAMCSVQPHGNTSSCTCPGAVMDVPMRECFLLQSQGNPFFPWLITQVMLPCTRRSPGSHSHPLFQIGRAHV